MGQMKFDGVRTTILDDGTVTVPSEDESGEPLKVGKLTRDGGKWVAVREGERRKEAFPRRQDALRHLVVRS
jgi:hypothetical protein